MTEAEKGVILREIRPQWKTRRRMSARRLRIDLSMAPPIETTLYTHYLVPGTNPFIPRIVRARLPPFIIFIIFCICSN
jgi:hypothetical protein